MRSPIGEPDSPLERGLSRGISLAVSVGAHVVAVLYLIKDPETRKQVEEWVEMAVVEQKAPEPPPPEPEPEPEPEKPKPQKEAMKFQDLQDTPPEAHPADPPPDANKPVRRVQGLSASSFAEGSGSGVSARAGTTVNTKAGPETMGIDEASQSSAGYASVQKKPKLKSKPPIVVPQEAIDAEIEGTWTVFVDLGADGRPTAVRLPTAIGYGIDAACIAAWQDSRWSPGEVDGAAVPVTGIPMKCTIKAVE